MHPHSRLDARSVNLVSVVANAPPVKPRIRAVCVGFALVFTVVRVSLFPSKALLGTSKVFILLVLPVFAQDAEDAALDGHLGRWNVDGLHQNQPYDYKRVTDYKSLTHTLKPLNTSNWTIGSAILQQNTRR